MTTCSRRSVEFKDDPEIINDSFITERDSELSSSIDINPDKMYIPKSMLRETTDTVKPGDEDDFDETRDVRGQDGKLADLEDEKAKHIKKIVADIHSPQLPILKTLNVGVQTSDFNRPNDRSHVLSHGPTVDKLEMCSNSENLNHLLMIHKKHNQKHISHIDAVKEELRNKINLHGNTMNKASVPINVQTGHTPSRNLSDNEKSAVFLPPAYPKLHAKYQKEHIPQVHEHLTQHLRSKELEIEQDLNSNLSYTSFPDKPSNFILTTADDWLKHGKRYDHDGFAIQSNFAHYDVNSKPALWLSQFRQTHQHGYDGRYGGTTKDQLGYGDPYRGAPEDLSIAENDQDFFVESYHSNHKLNGGFDKSFQPGEKGERNIFNNTTCMIFSLFLIGTALAVGIALLITYIV